MLQMRRVLGSMVAAVVLALTAQPAAAQAAPPVKKLSLSSYSVTITPPSAPGTVCDYNWFNCGFVSISASFDGLDRFPRPEGPIGSRPEGDLAGTIQVSRVYGCADASGKRLHRYDRTVSETAGIGSRRGTGFRIPRTGNTVHANSYAFLLDAQPHNCPAATTAMTYKLVVKQVRLELDMYVPEIPDGSYKVPSQVRWIGAVPTPTPAT
jgi:hypothetical protein